MTIPIWLLRAVFVSALMFTLTMAWLPHPPHVRGNPGDKIQHVVAFLTLSLLAAAAFPRASLLRIGERLSFLGALIEVVQNIPALHRDCDIMDWVADTAAVALALVLVWWLREHRRAHSYFQRAYDNDAADKGIDACVSNRSPANRSLTE